MSSVIEKNIDNNPKINEKNKNLLNSNILIYKDTNNANNLGIGNNHGQRKFINKQKPKLIYKTIDNCKINNGIKFPTINIKEISGKILPEKINILGDLSASDMEKLKKIKFFRVL